MAYKGKWSRVQEKPKYTGVQYMAHDTPKMYEEQDKHSVYDEPEQVVQLVWHGDTQEVPESIKSPEQVKHYK